MTIQVLFSKNLSVSAYVLSPASFQEYKPIKEMVISKKPIYLRTGGATLNEVSDIFKYIESFKNNKIILLGGIQLYPTPVKELRLKSLNKLRNEFNDSNLEFGLADHIDGDNPYAKFLRSCTWFRRNCIRKTHNN